MRANWVSRVQNSQQISLGYEWIGCRQQTDNQHRVVVDVVRKDRKREVALSCVVQAAWEARTVRWLEAVRVISPFGPSEKGEYVYCRRVSILLTTKRTYSKFRFKIFAFIRFFFLTRVLHNYLVFFTLSLSYLSLKKNKIVFYFVINLAQKQ